MERKNDRGEVTCASQKASKSHDLNLGRLSLVFQSLQNPKNAKEESPRGLAPSCGREHLRRRGMICWGTRKRCFSLREGIARDRAIL